MKFIPVSFILLLSSFAVAQSTTAPKETKPATPSTKKVASQPAATAPKHEDAARVAIAADAPVVTVPNICEKSDKDCKTIMTRKQFETALLGVSGGKMVPPEMPKRFASQYAEMLVFSKEAEKQGFDKDDETEAALRFARIQVLANRYLRVLEEKNKPTDDDVQKFYESNKVRFQGTSLDRVMIPAKHAKSKSPEELKAMAEDIKKRLTAGEDPAKLQAEVYTTLNLTNPPRTALTLTRGDPERDVLIEMPDGAISDVVDEQMALAVYKSHGKQPLPIETVKDEIYAKVYQEKMQAAIEALLADHKAVLNDDYFGKETAKKNPHQQ